MRLPIRSFPTQALAAATLLCALAMPASALGSSGSAEQPAGAPPEVGSGSSSRAVWISPGFLTWHVSEPAGRELEGRNPGVGLDWQWSAHQRLSVGQFRNRDREQSLYAALYHQPLEFGHWRIGVVAGVMDGYPNYRQGRVFPAILPVASWEQSRWAIDWAFIPTISDRLYGGISFRLRLRLH